MREFIIFGHTATIDSEYSLDDITGNTGRIDVLCRCINAAFFLSHGFRQSVTVHLVLQDELTIRFEGDSLRNLHPDERNIAAAIRNAIAAKAEAVGHQEATSAPGIHTAKFGFDVLFERIETDRLVQLTESGTPIPDAALPENPVFVLSDHHQFTQEEQASFTAEGLPSIRIGPRALHADHTMTIVHNYLDTNGYIDY
jgi:tRNA (pseudouridine54-N1)-methyltransferase